MHNLTKTLAAMSLLAPITAHSLGVGDIKLHSALNQKLNAEIALTLAADEDLADIKVTLATPDKFDKLGISWSYFLSKVKFQPVLKANGQVVIKVTSDEVVQEPFLDFLVEVSWPKGDVFKEFTVLVDPPVVYQQSNVNSPAISSTRAEYNTANTNAPIENNYSNLAAKGEYGPTNRNDSLWKVAEKVNKYSDVSVEQMMMALYKANPGAFYKKNVNALMEGKTLKIPEKTDIVRLSKKQANTEFYKQMAVWKGNAVAESEDLLQADGLESSKQLTLVPPAEEELSSSDALTANATDQQSLATENQQLQERLANLEKQFAIMQEMMAIKDQQLAILQNAQQSSEVDAETLLGQDDQATRDDTAEQVTQDSAQEKSADTSEMESIKDKEFSSKETIEKQSITKSVVEKATAPSFKESEKSAVEQDDGVNYYYLGLGIFGALGIGGLAWLLWRRRQAEEEINENSMFATSSEIFLPDTDNDDMDIPVFEEKSSYDVGTVGESSFLSEFTPSDFDVFETDQAEIDPTSEADVYLAYGRYQQAEELMRQAITDYPDNNDYKLKLLEIFYTSENDDSYEEYTKTLVAEGKNKDLNFWSKVTEMGNELLPESSLFSSEQTESKFAATEETPFASDNDIPDALEDVKVPEAEEEDEALITEAPSELEDDNSDIDFDLDSFSLDDNQIDLAESISAEEEKDQHSVDFDLSSFDSLDSSGEKELKPVKVSSDDRIESIEFDSDTTDDFDLDDFDFAGDLSVAESKEELATTTTTQSKLTDEDEKSDFDFDFDFDEIPDAPVTDKSSDTDSLAENDLTVSDLTDMDEFETKIDLAKAYVDMGDESAAQEIAQEVLEKGNDAQKLEAQKIIDKLS